MPCQAVAVTAKARPGRRGTLSPLSRFILYRVCGKPNPRCSAHPRPGPGRGRPNGSLPQCAHVSSSRRKLHLTQKAKPPIFVRRMADKVAQVTNASFPTLATLQSKHNERPQTGSEGSFRASHWAFTAPDRPSC